MKKYVLKWELAGIVFVFLVGALLHFLFEWSGESLLIGAFASVNESVWEHFKQGFWPMCLFAFIEYLFPGMRVKNFLAAKAVAVYLIPVITGLAFYGYTTVVGHEILILDILIFLFAVAIGQLVSYRILTAGQFSSRIVRVAGMFILLLAGLLVVTTFWPPHWPIFMDHNTGLYGIP